MPLPVHLKSDDAAQLLQAVAEAGRADTVLLARLRICLNDGQGVNMERKLAAILAADVVGYSAQMERDEAGTFERLKAGRKELFEPAIAQHHGRIFKLMGDGLLAEFASVVDAVECAVALQRGLAERNASLQSAEQTLVRIGINLGEVIVEGDDRYGDGVNIASRLEQLAEPGGICVSGKVAKEVEKKLAFGFEPMGEKKVKNISEPVQVFRITLEKQTHNRLPNKLRWALPAIAVLAILSVGAAAAWQFWPTTSAREKPTVAVLPFNNYGGDEATGRLADGLTEDIITDLSRFRDFDVVARNSTEVYKGKPIDIRSIATALGVGYVVEGSIQKEAGRVRVTAQLIDAASGNHLWSERWDRPDKDVFTVQTEIAQRITNQLGGGPGLIRQAERDTARRKRPDNLTAYELFLLGEEKVQSPNTASQKEALALLTEAIELDPGLARAWTALFHAYDVLAWAGVDEEKNRQLASEAARRAVELDPNDVDARIALGSSFGNQGDLIRAKGELDIALRLAPGSATVLTHYASWSATFGDPARGGELADQAIRLDPNYPMWAAGRFAYAYFAADRYADALRVLERSTPDTYSPDIWVVHPASLAALGRIEEANNWVKEALKHHPDFTIEGWANEVGYSDEERQRFVKTMKLAGFPACAKPETLAKIANPIRLPECAKA